MLVVDVAVQKVSNSFLVVAAIGVREYCAIGIRNAWPNLLISLSNFPRRELETTVPWAYKMRGPILLFRSLTSLEGYPFTVGQK